MIRRLALTVAAAAVLAGPVLAGPALAQDVAEPAAVETPAKAVVTEADVDQADAEFETQMRAMAADLRAAHAAAGTDRVKAATDADAIVARYQPSADAFADLLQAYSAEAQAEFSAQERDEMVRSVATVRGVPVALRRRLIDNAQ